MSFSPLLQRITRNERGNILKKEEPPRLHHPLLINFIRNIFPYTYAVKQIHPIRTIEPTSKRTSTINSIIDNNKDVKVYTLL